jgi:hypothetical protein
LTLYLLTRNILKVKNIWDWNTPLAHISFPSFIFVTLSLLSYHNPLCLYTVDSMVDHKQVTHLFMTDQLIEESCNW